MKTITSFRTDSKIITQFLSKINFTETCWLWMGSFNLGGYGQFRAGHKMTTAHRFSYYLYTGQIEKGLVIDHLCGISLCVRPDHLELVTTQENTRRGNAGINSRSKTHCSNGHEYSEENTRIINERGWRACRACSVKNTTEGRKRRRKVYH